MFNCLQCGIEFDEARATTPDFKHPMLFCMKTCEDLHPLPSYKEFQKLRVKEWRRWHDGRLSLSERDKAHRNWTNYGRIMNRYHGRYHVGMMLLMPGHL
jgi:hypothetical protein